MPQCENNGICIKPGVCSCAENFVGTYCEHRKKLCLTRPHVPRNSMLSCSSTSCTITCAKGYVFPDGFSITNMWCENGEWIPSHHPDQKLVPDCKRMLQIIHFILLIYSNRWFSFPRKV